MGFQPLEHIDRAAVKADALRAVGQGETLTSVAKRHGISRQLLSYEWPRQDPDYAQALDQARLSGADAMADELVRIADGDDIDDEVEIRDLTTGKSGVGTRKEKLAAIGGDPVARARLRMDTRLKVLAARFPHLYGNKVLMAGHDGGTIKSESVTASVSVKALAAQLREAAAARTVEHQPLDLEAPAPQAEGDGRHGKGARASSKGLTTSSERFNDGVIDNDSEQSNGADPTPQRQMGQSVGQGAAGMRGAGLAGPAAREQAAVLAEPDGRADSGAGLARRLAPALDAASAGRPAGGSIEAPQGWGEGGNSGRRAAGGPTATTQTATTSPNLSTKQLSATRDTPSVTQASTPSQNFSENSWSPEDYV